MILRIKKATIFYTLWIEHNKNSYVFLQNLSTDLNNSIDRALVLSRKYNININPIKLM